MYEGAVVAVLDGSAATPKEIGFLMAGGKR
jgi:hypothetical protein